MNNKIRLTALVVALITIFMLSVSSYAESDWQQITSIDFSSSVNLQKAELTSRFDATVKNGVLEMKSDDICEWVAKDLSTPNADLNTVNGLKVNGLGGALMEFDTPYTYNGETYTHYNGSDVGWLMTEIQGKKALAIVCYPKISSATETPTRATSNYYKMKVVDNALFLDNVAGSYDFEVEYYIPSASRARTLNFAGSSNSSLTKGAWTTWKFTKNMTSLSGDLWLQQSNVNPYYWSDAQIYVSRISIKKSKTETPVYSAKEKTAVMDLDLDEKFGNTAVSFDITLPATTRLSDTVYYNNGTKNSGRFGIADENGNFLGAVQLDTTTGGSQIISAINGETDALVELYSGDILGRTLTYCFETDWTAETYTVDVLLNDTSISNDGQPFGPFPMMNADAAGNANVRQVRFVHHSTNAAMLTQIDNLSAEFIENPDYAQCKLDAEALELDIPEDGIVTDDIILPTVGAESGAAIAWASSDAAAVVTTEDDVCICTVTRGAERQDVTLTATLEIQGVQVVKTFDITIEKSADILLAEEDAEAIVLEIPEDGIVTEGFSLPKEGSVNASFISWASNSPAVQVDNSLGTCSVVRGAERVSVTLTATAYHGDFSASKTFDVTVEKHEDQLAAEEIAATMDLGLPDNLRIRENFELPDALDGASITWVSDDESVIEVVDNVAVITRGQSENTAKLTATVTIGGYTATREYNITVASLFGTYSNVGEVEETITAGVLSATVNVQSPGNSGTLHFAAVAIDPATGQIKDRASASQALTGDTRYATVTLSVSDLAVASGDDVEYYIWNENRESLRNNAPGDVTGITAVGRGKGVRLNWTAALDDNNAVDAYSIYRDNEYIGSALGSETTYLDTGAEIGVAHEYKIIAEDSNGFKGGSDVKTGEPALGMYFIDYHKKYSGEPKENYLNGFVDFRFTESGDAYAFPLQVTDANGETYWVACTDKKYIMCNVDSTKITGMDRELTIEVVYLDTSGTFDLYYNKELPAGEEDTTANMFNYARAKKASVVTETGSRTWKTAVINLTDAQFRAKGSTGCDFAFYGGNVDRSMYIREIRIIQTPLYD